MKSTSIHNLNGDKKLLLPLRYLWLGVNWLNNNLFPNARDNSLNIQDFVPDVSDTYWSQTHIKSSPSRKLSDLFWLQLPWEKILRELEHINILDTGCGSGNYGVNLQSYTNGNIASYTGIDMFQHNNWNTLVEKYSNFSFQKLESGDILEHIPDKTNLFISQSAIEHFEHDLLYFKQICEFAQRTSKNMIQIHLFPSGACLKLYSHHGVRQYTPRTVSYITHLFQGFSYSTLYKLGGIECNKLHWEYITRPIHEKIGDLREARTEEYNERLRLAIKADNKKPHLDPSFYALVIHSNWSKVIF